MEEPSTQHSDGPETDVLDSVRADSKPFPVPATGTFSGEESGGAFADVFDATFDDQTIVGLGEATHGTHEFFRVKTRLIRYLVEQRGYRLLCMEAQFTPTLAINEYVRGGTAASGRTAVDVLDDADIIGNWQCEAVADLIEWLRTFNEGRDPADTVAIHGIDAQRQHLPASALSAFLSRVDIDVPPPLLEALDTLDSQPYMQLGDAERDAYRDACETVADELASHFDAHEAAYVDATSREALRRASYQRRTIAQARQLAAAQEDAGRAGYNDAREAVMAENVSRLLDYATIDWAVVWAHNTHIGRGALHDDDEVPSLGERLDAEFGDYYALGLETGGGNVRCYSLSESTFATPALPQPPAGSVPGMFTRAGETPFVLDFDDITTGGPLDSWFQTCPRQHYVGGAYEESPAEYISADPREAFDGLVFFASTTPAHPVSED